MTSVPAPVNQTVDTANNVVDASIRGVVAAVEALIFADVPALALPIVKSFVVAIIAWVVSYVQKAAKEGVTFTIIDLQVGSEEDKLHAALVALIAAQKSGDPNAIQAAIKNYASAHSSLVRDDGGASTI